MPRGIFFYLGKFPFTPGPLPEPSWWDSEDDGLDD